jgi:colanic acid/amylovoran biosynthesis glycosyltransferase
VSRPTVRAGYCVRRFPQLTQTFVTNEIAAVGRLDVEVRVASLLPGDGEPTVPTTVLRGYGHRVRALAGSAAFLALHPRRTVAAARVGWRLRDELGTRSSRASVAGLLAVAVEWERAGVQVLHAHFAWEGAAAAMVLSRLLGVPWSVTVHANDMYASRMHLAEKLADADVVVTVCEYNRERLRDDEHHPGPIPIVVCGVESWDGERREPQRPTLVAVGRLVEKKGVDLALEALATLAPRHPGLRLVVVGDGPLEHRLRDLAAQLDVGERVEWAGALDHDDTLARIEAATVFVAPYRIAADGDRDSMPVAVKEAMVRSVPVVGTDVAGVPEMLEDGCGVLVPVDDAAALAEGIEALLRDPGRRAAIADAARQRAEQHYLLQQTGQAMRDVLDELVASRA